MSMVAVLVLAEVLTRTYLFPRSADYRKFGAYDERARALAATPGLRVAVIGNSAIEHGLDPGLLSDELSSRCAQEVKCERFWAADSSIDTWRFMLERMFWKPGRRMDLTVLAFFDDGCADGNYLETGRLAHVFATPSDWPEIFTHHVPDLGSRVDFVVSSVLAVYAVRWRLRDRLLTAVVPSYEETARRMRAVERPAARPARKRSYRALERTIERARETGTRLCVLALPTLHPVGQTLPLDTGLRRLASRSGVHVIDLRSVRGIQPGDFADRVHLRPSGRRKVTDALVPLLQQILCTGGRAAWPQGPGRILIPGHDRPSD